MNSGSIIFHYTEHNPLNLCRRYKVCGLIVGPLLLFRRISEGCSCSHGKYHYWSQCNFLLKKKSRPTSLLFSFYVSASGHWYKSRKLFHFWYLKSLFAAPCCCPAQVLLLKGTSWLCALLWSCKTIIQASVLWAREMVQWIKKFVVKPNNPSSIHGSHMVEEERESTHKQSGLWPPHMSHGMFAYMHKINTLKFSQNPFRINFLH